MHLKSCLIMSTLAAMLCSCSSVMKRIDHKTTVGSDKALLSMYYRFNPLVGAPIEVFVDSKSKGQATMRTCLQAEVSPGKHTIYALIGRNWGVMDAEFEAGKKYYAYLVGLPDMFSAGRVSIDPVTADENPAAVAEEFRKAATFMVDPAQKSAWESKRARVPARIKKRHDAGNTKPTTLSIGDGI